MLSYKPLLYPGRSFGDVTSDEGDDCNTGPVHDGAMSIDISVRTDSWLDTVSVT